MVNKYLARRDPAVFAQYVDPEFAAQYQRPHAQLVFAWMARALDGSLFDGLSGGGPRILLLSLPPGHYKSSIANKVAAWFVGSRKRADRPHQIALTSYGADLAETNSRAVRDTIDSDLFRQVFPGTVIDPASRSVSSWALAGEVITTCKAVGVGGPLTGHRAHLLIIDDPVKDASQAYSAAARESLWQWWLTVAQTRLTGESVVIIPHTRWHDDDLTGRILRTEQEEPGTYRVRLLRLPAVAEDNEQRRESARVLALDADETDDPLGRAPGEALCPAIMDVAMLGSIRAADTTTFANMYQGVPKPEGGYMLGRGQFHLLEAPPTEGRIEWCLPSDWALTERQMAPRQKNDPDYTVVGLLGLWYPDVDNRRDARLVLAAVARTQAQIADAQRFVKQFMGRVRDRLDAQPPLAAAQDNVDRIALQGLRTDPGLLTWPIEDVTRGMMKGDKVVKSHGWRSRATDGQFYVVRDSWWGTRWNDAFFSEVEGFPRAAHDDQIDMVSVGTHYLSGARRVMRQARSYQG